MKMSPTAFLEAPFAESEKMLDDTSVAHSAAKRAGPWGGLKASYPVSWLDEPEGLQLAEMMDGRMAEVLDGWKAVVTVDGLVLSKGVDSGTSLGVC